MWRLVGALELASQKTYEAKAVGEKKVSTTVYITQRQSEQLKELHARTKVPIAEYIRQGIDLILEQNSDKLPGQLSLMK